MAEFQDSSTRTQADSKDFVEQLRLVHFTLVVTCVALVVVTFSPPPPLMKKAQDELRQIIEVSQNGVWPEHVLEDATTVEFKEDSMTGKKSYFRTPCPTKFGELSLKVGNKYFDGQYTGNPAIIDISHSLKSRSMPPPIPPPITVEEFRKIWDSRLIKVCPATLGAAMVTVDLRLLDMPVQFVSKSTLKKPIPLDFYLISNEMLLETEKLPKDGFSLAGKRPSHAAGIVISVIGTKEVPIGLQQKIVSIAATHGAHWRLGNFKDAFYELDSITTGFQTLPLGDMVLVLQAQSQSGKENFEAFGVKFPAQETIRWGVPLIIGIQLYFWLHVAEYRRRNFPLTDVAWIGAYPLLVSRIAFFVTAALAPFAVVGVLLFFHHDSPFNRYFSDVIFATSGLLAAVAWKEHRQSNLVKSTTPSKIVANSLVSVPAKEDKSLQP